jgi:hypothetical protein
MSVITSTHNRIACLAVLASVVAGCGAATGAVQSGAGSESAPASAAPTIATVITPGGSEPMTFPMKTIRGYTQVAQGSVPDSAKLPFDATFPGSAGSPIGVFVSPIDPSAPTDVEIDAEYGTDTPYGAFRLEERHFATGDFDQSFIESIPSQCGDCTDARTLTVAPGVMGALLAGGSGPVSVTWLQGQYELIVMGPRDTFSADTAIKVATEIAASFDTSQKFTQSTS